MSTEPSPRRWGPPLGPRPLMVTTNSLLFSGLSPLWAMRERCTMLYHPVCDEGCRGLKTSVLCPQPRFPSWVLLSIVGALLYLRQLSSVLFVDILCLPDVSTHLPHTKYTKITVLITQNQFYIMSPHWLVTANARATSLRIGWNVTECACGSAR